MEKNDGQEGNNQKATGGSTISPANRIRTYMESASKRQETAQINAQGSMAWQVFSLFGEHFARLAEKSKTRQ